MTAAPSPAKGASATRFGRKSHISTRGVLLLSAAALGLQALLPAIHPSLTSLNIPLLVVICISVSVQQVVPAVLAGALIGWAQDGLTHMPVGVLGIVYSVLGYVSATAGQFFRLGYSHVLCLFVAAAYLLHEVLLHAIGLYLLGDPPRAHLGMWGAMTVLHAGAALLIYPVYKKMVVSP